MRRIIGDLPLLLIASSLSLYGVAMVYSAGVTDTPTFVHNLYRAQFVWILIGLLGAYAISRSSVRFVEREVLPRAPGAGSPSAGTDCSGADS